MSPAKYAYDSIFVLLLLARGVVAKEFVDKFGLCKENVGPVFNGTGTFMGMDKAAMQEQGYFYDEWPRELPRDTSYARENYPTLTYIGCKALCGRGNDKAQLAEPSFALNMVTTWIFPLAIVLSLPYDSLHSKRWSGTARALLNWLGSPQTALTATIFNFHQIIRAHRKAKNSEVSDPITLDNVYYVISCLNQFDVTSHVTGNHVEFFEVLVYGLFNPMVSTDDDSAIRYTKASLTAIAHQLRMHRRRAFIPTMLNLGTFLIAFVFSIVLSFAQVGEHTKVDMLVLGLLFTWLPMLVIFTNVDRTPVSADRTAELLSRWLYNVDVIRTWNRDKPTPQPSSWWLPPVLTSEDQTEPDSVSTSSTQVSDTDEDVDNPFQLKSYIGQGRKLQACCLSSVLMEIGDSLHRRRTKGNIREYKTSAPYDKGGREVLHQLSMSPPASWYGTAIAGLLIVWTSITMALLLAYNTPTIGLGCWSGSFLIFGVLSSITWILQFIRPQRPSIIVQRICTFFNALSLGWLVTIVILMVTGATNTCWCISVHLFPQFGDYVNLESASFYRQYCNVVQFWAVATGVGLTMPTVGIFFTSLLWRECQHLWRANEKKRNQALRDTEINWVWLT